MSKRNHLCISWDYDESITKFSANNNLVIVFYDASKKINKIFRVNLNPLKRDDSSKLSCNRRWDFCYNGHPHNEVDLKYLYTNPDERPRTKQCEKKSPWNFIDFGANPASCGYVEDEYKLQTDYNTVKKYLRNYGSNDYSYHDRVSVDKIDENILHFKFLKSNFEDDGSKESFFDVQTLEGSPIVGSSIYILNFSELKNGSISFYMNSINETSLIFSKNFDNLDTLPYIKFLKTSNIKKVSADPEDCEYVWDQDTSCMTETGETNGYMREILRITDTSRNGGVPCKVVDYGDIRFTQCVVSTE